MTNDVAQKQVDERDEVIRLRVQLEQAKKKIEKLESERCEGYAFKLDPYCKGCRDFDAFTEKVVWAEDSDTTISCANAEHCKRIYKQFKQNFLE